MDLFFILGVSFVIVAIALMCFSGTHPDVFSGVGGFGVDKKLAAGRHGEWAVYKELIDTVGVPEAQILRNVYIPTKDGGSSEIDLLVVSKKGIFVFECKNYGGNVYGDARLENWIQYFGKKKSAFYNPLLQNRTHCQNLRAHLYRRQLISSGFPIVSMISTTNRGTWKIRNLSPKDYILGYNSHFVDIYNSMPVCPEINLAVVHNILNELKPFSDPDDETVEKHVMKVEMVKGNRSKST